MNLTINSSPQLSLVIYLLLVPSGSFVVIGALAAVVLVAAIAARYRFEFQRGMSRVSIGPRSIAKRSRRVKAKSSGPGPAKGGKLIRDVRGDANIAEAVRGATVRSACAGNEFDDVMSAPSRVVSGSCGRGPRTRVTSHAGAGRSGGRALDGGRGRGGGD